jgi:hypothetical protein
VRFLPLVTAMVTSRHVAAMLQGMMPVCWRTDLWGRRVIWRDSA